MTLHTPDHAKKVVFSGDRNRVIRKAFKDARDRAVVPKRDSKRRRRRRTR